MEADLKVGKKGEPLLEQLTELKDPLMRGDVVSFIKCVGLGPGLESPLNQGNSWGWVSNGGHLVNHLSRIPLRVLMGQKQPHGTGNVPFILPSKEKVGTEMMLPVHQLSSVSKVKVDGGKQNPPIWIAC